MDSYNARCLVGGSLEESRGISKAFSYIDRALQLYGLHLRGRPFSLGFLVSLLDYVVGEKRNLRAATTPTQAAPG
jgi:hypothetical protein